MEKSHKDFNPNELVSKVFDTYEMTIDKKDLILYALGIGFSKDPLNQNDFKFTYENNDKFTSFPSIPAAMAVKGFRAITIEGFPKYDIN